MIVTLGHNAAESSEEFQILLFILIILDWNLKVSKEDLIYTDFSKS